MNPRMVITDLDGTLLDAVTYAWESSREALEELRRRGIPVVFCTSKTRAETEDLRREMGNDDPFIVENGGSVIMADETLVLGIPYNRILEEFRRLKERVDVRGFSDMTVEEIAALCNMSIEAARRAKSREYDEPFLCDEDPVPYLRGTNLQCHRGGRFWHLHGSTDKGRAVRALLERIGARRTIGLGDSLTDVPMLLATDVPVLIPGPDGAVDPVLKDLVPHGRIASQPGPLGWNSTIMMILSECRPASDRTVRSDTV